MPQFFTLRNSEEIIWINLSLWLPEMVHMQGLRGPGREAYGWYVERHARSVTTQMTIYGNRARK
jgi:hypothetical protein